MDPQLHFNDPDEYMGAKAGCLFYSLFGSLLISAFFSNEIYEKIHSGYEEKLVVGKSEVFYNVKGQEDYDIKEVKGNGSVVEYDIRPHLHELPSSSEIGINYKKNSGHGVRITDSSGVSTFRDDLPAHTEFLKRAEFLVSEYYGQTGKTDRVTKKRQENLQKKSRIEKALLE